jgi:hypothetical protein
MVDIPPAGGGKFMFWIMMIAIVAGTYYVVQWGKKKAEQQAREEAEQERQGRPIQPPAQSPATQLTPPPPAMPFDLSKGRVTAQLTAQIGRWTESDATAALGAPTKPRPPKPSGEHIDDYAYVDSAGVAHTVALAFNRGRLTALTAYTQGLSFEEVRQALGEPIPHPEAAALEAAQVDPAYDYGSMWVFVDKTGGVRFFSIRNASAAASFLSGASWTTRVP